MQQREGCKLKYDIHMQMDMPASLPFSKSFDFASGATAERFQNPFWKLKEFFFGALLRKAVFDIKAFGHKIVSAAVQRRQEGRGSSTYDTAKEADPLRNNLINSLLDNIDDHQMVADAAMNYLSAGKWALLHLQHVIIDLCFRQRYHSSISNLDTVSLDAPSAYTRKYILRIALNVRRSPRRASVIF